MLLTEQRRYDDAAKIMLDIKKRMAILLRLRAGWPGFADNGAKKQRLL